MSVLTGDDIDVELLRDKPTLFYERLRYFLSANDADRVLNELAFICHRCWDGERGACKCGDGSARVSKKASEGVSHLDSDECCHFQD